MAILIAPGKNLNCAKRKFTPERQFVVRSSQFTVTDTGGASSANYEL